MDMAAAFLAPVRIAGYANVFARALQVSDLALEAAHFPVVLAALAL
jgi:hypothetical protein